MTDDENLTAMQVKAELGGGQHEHLGESAVIACARHRGLVAVLDDRAAIGQAERRGVTSLDTLAIVVRAYKFVYAKDRDKVIAVVDALIGMGMYLPFRSGAELFDWGVQRGHPSVVASCVSMCGGMVASLKADRSRTPGRVHRRHRKGKLADLTVDDELWELKSTPGPVLTPSPATSGGPRSRTSLTASSCGRSS